jgi:hypothetical protein
VAYFKALALGECPAKNHVKLEGVVPGNPCCGRNEFTSPVIVFMMVVVVVVVVVV